MTPFAVKIGDIPKSLFLCFKEMRQKLETLPDFEDEEFTCHSVCAAFAKRYSLQVIDGRFSDIFDHSWIVDQNYPKVLIDLYPVAGGSPLIVSASNTLLPWRKLYSPKNINYDQISFERQKRKLLLVI